MYIPICIYNSWKHPTKSTNHHIPSPAWVASSKLPDKMPTSGVSGFGGTVGSSPTFFRFRSCDELGDKIEPTGLRGLGGWGVGEGEEVKMEPGRMLIFAGIMGGLGLQESTSENRITTT